MRINALHVSSALCLLLAGIGHADERPWAWTYGSAMLAPGEAELEHYMTLSTPDWSRRETTLSAQHQVELEIGMSERFDFAVYQVFERAPGEPLDWTGFKLRARWRLLGEESFGHPVLYGEYKGDATLSEPEWEAKLLLEERFGAWSFALNPILEIEGDETEFEAAAGASLRLLPLLSLGAEVRTSEYGTWVGPVIHHGGGGLYANLGAGWSLGDPEGGKPTHEVRLVIGLNVREGR